MFCISVNHRNCNRVQDAYTLRCCPQVHGIAHDTIDFVKGILNVELNSATDNPVGYDWMYHNSISCVPALREK